MVNKQQVRKDLETYMLDRITDAIGDGGDRYETVGIPQRLFMADMSHMLMLILARTIASYSKVPAEQVGATLAEYITTMRKEQTEGK